MSIDLSTFAVVGTNDSTKQVSVTKWNSLMTTLQAGVNTAGGGSSVYVNLATYLNPVRTPFVTDDLAAFDAALAALKALYVNDANVPTLYIPAGRYYCSSTVNVHVPCRIIGGGSGNGPSGSLIRFGNNCNGFVFNHGNTHGDTIGTQGSATGSSLEGVTLYGGNIAVNASGVITSYSAGSSTTGHGIRIRSTFISVIETFVAFFGQDGIHINCTAGSGGIIEGNANNFYLERVQSIYNGRFGYLTSGSDSNAGMFNLCSAITNGGCGFAEYSFLGNIYLMPHARDNGIANPVGNGLGVGSATYGGLFYYPVHSQLVAASTTTPGTNSAIWRAYNGYGGRAWVTGLTWEIGGAYSTNPANVNNCTKFYNAYAEDQQAPVQARYPVHFDSNLLNIGFDTDSDCAVTKVGVGGIYRSVQGFEAIGTSTVRMGANLGEQLSYFANGTDTFNLARVSSKINEVHQNAVTAHSIGLSSLGTAGFQAYHHFFERLIIGGTGNATAGIRMGAVNSSTDLTGQTVTRGDKFHYLNPSASGFEGIVCVTGGIVGTTAVFKTFGSISA